MDENKDMEAKNRNLKAKVQGVKIKTHSEKKFQVILTGIISFMLVLVLIILTFAHIKPENKDIFSLITGTLTGAFLTCCGYWFTSQKNDKNQGK